MIDTGMIGKGFGIAALGIGTGIAFGAMKEAVDNKKFKPKKFKSFKMKGFMF